MGPDPHRRTTVLDRLTAPIVLAPMAGGPSTPALAIAVSRGGGLGFLAAGYLTPEKMKENVDLTRGHVGDFGVNVFVVGGEPADPELVRGYADLLAEEAQRAGVGLGDPTFDDDGFEGKIEILRREPVAVVSFTFGIPPGDVVEALHGAGSEVWLTVTSPDEARQAASAGADALVVQGFEAGGHRGVFADDDAQSDLSLLAALQLVRNEVELPLIGAGAVMTGGAVGAVLVAGASAVQMGTAYLRTPEAGTSQAQREATATDRRTVITRAFSGRPARGIANRMHEQYGQHAPRAYPEINHLTSELRAHGRAVGDLDLINLWAGQAHELAASLPAEELTRRLAREAREAVTAWASKLS